MQASLAKATKPVPKVASAFYDKTGLIKDETVDKIYDSAVSALTSIHGFSAAKAQQIISEGVYNVQHPPIKIDWSQNLEIAENAAEDRIYTESLQGANLQDAALGITNKQIEATTKAIESVRGLWQSNYMIPVLDSGEEVKNPDGSTKMQAMPSIMAGTRSGLEQEFRNSPEYKQLAIDSRVSSLPLTILTLPFPVCMEVLTIYLLLVLRRLRMILTQPKCIIYRTLTVMVAHQRVTYI